MNYLKFLVSIVLFFSAFSCDVEDDIIGLEGTWEVTNTEALAISNISANNGNRLSFSSCESLCEGSDYTNADQSTGTFTYTYDQVDNAIIIIDNSEVGLNYSGTWFILDLSATNLRMTNETSLFGNVILQFKRL